MLRATAHIIAKINVFFMSEKDCNDYLVNTHSPEELDSMSLKQKKELILFLEFNYIEGCQEKQLDIVYKEKTLYNVAGDLGFSILTTNPEQPTNEEIIAALERRIEILKQNPDEIQEAVGIYDVPDEPENLADIEKWLKINQD